MKALNWLLLTILVSLLAFGCGKKSALEGKIVDGKGEPIADVKIIAKQVQPIKGYEQFEATTGSDGTFSFGKLFPSSKYILLPHSEDWKTSVKKTVRSGQEEETLKLKSPLLIRFTMSKAGVITDPRTGLMWAPYPEPKDFTVDIAAEKEMNFLQRLIGAVRNIRSEMRVPPDRKADVVLIGCSVEHRNLIEENNDDIKRLAAVSEIEFSRDKPQQAATAVVDELVLFVPLSGLIDLDLERERLDKEIERLRKLIKGAEGKLSNEKFLSKAPENIVEHEREKLESCREQLGMVEKNRAALD